MVADRTSGGFGGKLREARERRGISLRQIANATKISVGSLEALERNDTSRLPGGIFSRAFVRSYASEIGLDPDATIQEFIAAFPNDAGPAHNAAGHDEDHVSVESERRTAGTFLWLILLSLPIAGAVNLLCRRRAPRAAAGAAGHGDDTDARNRARGGAETGVDRRGGRSRTVRGAGAATIGFSAGGRTARGRSGRDAGGGAGRGRTPDRRAVGQAAVLGVGLGRRDAADRAAAAAG
jgi:transcriptional regulator with XRE-family HTH domain